jgi:cell division septum initiation protein DivIVA
MPSSSFNSSNNQDVDNDIPRLQGHNRVLKKQNKALNSALEQEEENLRNALAIASSSSASPGVKGARVRGECGEQNSDSVRMSDAALKRARQENVMGPNLNPLSVIELD